MIKHLGRLCRFAIFATAILVSFETGAESKTFRWSNDGDATTMDPHARSDGFVTSFDMNMYEPLLIRDRNLKLAPVLATEWANTNPTTWRFKLRHGVKFHDGTPMTADDVIFSMQRAMATGADVAAMLTTVKQVVKIDDYTVDFLTNGPSPILPNYLVGVAIMSKAWCEAHDTTLAASHEDKENYATRNENGTGPFILKDRQPAVRTVLVKNPNWWGLPEQPIDIDEVVFTRIANAATRAAALLSGELDMVYNVPLQDIDRIRNTPGMKIWQTPELRTIFLGMDQSRPELLESNVKGRNPFKDKRVRQAFYQAIDEDAITSKVMRGFARPTALMVGPGVNGFDPALDKRFPYDPAAAKKLLAEAGFPAGFEVGFDCPNDRYVNDQAICQAIVFMLARVGIKADLLAQTKAKYFGKINAPNYDTSFYLLGWTPTPLDALNMLSELCATRSGDAREGIYNNEGYSNPALDVLIKQIEVELDGEKRNDEISQALRIVKDDFAYIPLHQQIVVWATRANVDLAVLGNDDFQWRYVKMK
ncbi:ABC transporter substrate-binding protein [Rhodopila sp.]|uniref:ABC transporter substrate-binding protein n=1 Tax=Rhodopila sp. TaxID=2480087 RepID=UPI003D14ADD1